MKRGHMKGVPDPVDAAGEVQLLLAGSQWFIRFLGMIVDNNPMDGNLFVYGYSSLDPPRGITDSKKMILIELPGTVNGAVEDGMPSIIDVPLSEVRTGTGEPVDYKLIQSLVVCKPIVPVQNKEPNPTMVYASCNLLEEPIRVRNEQV